MRFTKAFSVFGLANEFRQEIGTLVKDEVQLAKLELGEKFTLLKKNAIALGIGTFVAFAGLVLVSLSVGKLLALAFEGLGWSEALSNFVGITTAGLVIALIGLVFALKGVKTLSSSSLKPERTIDTLRELTGKPEHSTTKAEDPAPPQPGREELQARIDHTRQDLKHTMTKARRRLAWSSAAMVFRRHPMRMLALGAGAGLARRMIRNRRAKHTGVNV